MGHPEIFYSEVMNDDAAGTRSGVDFSKINVWLDNQPGMPLDHDAGFVIIDPSAAKKKSDDVAIGCCLVINSEPILREVKLGRFNPLQQCDESIKLAAKYGLTAIVVEDVAYQATLMFWMNQRLAQLGLTNIRVLPINPRGQSKPFRIKEMLKQLTAQLSRIWVHKDCRSLLVHQITYYDPLKPNNKDDLLDIMAYFYQVIQQYAADILVVIDVMATTVSAAFSDDLQLEF